MEELTYEDEVLPMLEIEELITLEEMVRLQPSFVAFSPDELRFLIQQLVASPLRARTFSRLHTSVLEPLRSSFLHWSDISLDVEKVLHHEDGDVEELQQAILSAPNYDTQQELYRSFYAPYHVDNAIGHRPFLLMQHINFSAPSVGSGVILEDDRPKYPITHVAWKPRSFGRWDYLFDLPFTFTTYPKVALPQHRIDLESWIKDHTRPTLANILTAMPSTISFHTLQRWLHAHGYDWGELTEADYSTLQVHMRPLVEEALPTDKEGTSRHLAPRLRTSFVKFWDVAKAHHARALSENQEEEYMRLMAAYQAHVSRIGALASDLSMDTPHELAEQLRSNTLQMGDVIDRLREWVQRWNLDIMGRFADRYKHLSPQPAWDVHPEVDTDASKRDDLGTQFISVHHEVHDMVEGTSTTMYDGNPTSIHQEVYEDIEQDFVISTEDEDPMDRAATIATAPPPSFTLDALHDAPQGVLDILHEVARRLSAVQQASGLPWNIESYLVQAQSHLVATSRVEQLLQAVPELVEVVARALVTPTLSTSIARIRELQNAVLADKIEAAYERIHHAWERTCESMTIHVATLWWLDLCKQSLQGSLSFSPLRGMIVHLHAWGPFGPPMESTSKQGILPYLCEVMKTVLPTVTSVEAVRKQMAELAAQWYAPHVEELHLRWTQIKDGRGVMDKASLAKVSIIEAIEAIKEGKKVDVLPSYVQAMLYLPGILPTKKQVVKAHRWIQGCCAAPLTQDYEADMDWRHLHAIYKIKQGLAKKRWQWNERPSWVHFPKDLEQTLVKSKHVAEVVHQEHNGPLPSAPLSESAPVWDQQDWLLRTHISMLKSTRDTEQWMKHTVTRVFPRSTSKQGNLLRVLQNIQHTTDALSLMAKMACGWDVPTRERCMDVYTKVRRFLATIAMEENVRHILPYCVLLVFLMPASPDAQHLSAPEGISMQTVASIWDANFQAMLLWDKTIGGTSIQDIQAFVTKMREEQKEISLRKLNAMTLEDRQLVLDTKKLGLLKLVEREELTDRATALDKEGEDEFLLRTSDPDQEDTL
jgi:hypothetical protein